jgi:hypothetical protein
MLNEFLWSQLSGPLAQDTINAIQACDTDTNPILEYFYDLSIDEASEAELTILGLLIGIPWPTAPSGTFDDNVFIFGAAGSLGSVIDYNRGFGSLSTGRGGVFRGSSYIASQKLPIGSYRQLLKAIAKLKWTGLSFAAIDAIVSSFTLNYVYLWDLAAPTDLHIKVSSAAVSPGGLFIMQRIFDRFSTDPYIEVSRGTI